MSTAIPLVKKELLEQWRTNKILIIVLGFLFIGIQGPVLAKLLPDLIKNASSSIKGMQITVPEQTAQDALVSYFNSMATMPALVLILVAMGAVAGERERGTLGLVLTKPVTRTAFILWKYFSFLGVVALAILVTGLASAYYTLLLFNNDFQFGAFLVLNLTMLSSMAFMLSLVMFASTLLKTALAAGGVSFLLVVLFSTVIRFLPGYTTYTPQVVFDVTAGRDYLSGKESLTGLILPTVIGFVASAVVLAVSCFMAEKREM